MERGRMDGWKVDGPEVDRWAAAQLFLNHGAAPASPQMQSQIACPSPASPFPHSWTRTRDTWTPDFGHHLPKPPWCQLMILHLSFTSGVHQRVFRFPAPTDICDVLTIVLTSPLEERNSNNKVPLRFRSCFSPQFDWINDLIYCRDHQQKQSENQTKGRTFTAQDPVQNSTILSLVGICCLNLYRTNTRKAFQN